MSEEKEDYVYFNQEVDIAIMPYSSVLDLIRKNIILENQVKDLKKIVRGWEDVQKFFLEMEFAEEGMYTEEETTPYEYMY